MKCNELGIKDPSIQEEKIPWLVLVRYLASKRRSISPDLEKGCGYSLMHLIRKKTGTDFRPLNSPEKEK